MYISINACQHLARGLGCWVCKRAGRALVLMTCWVSPAAVRTAQPPSPPSPPLPSSSPAAMSSFGHITHVLLGDPVHQTQLAKAIYVSLYLTESQQRGGQGGAAHPTMGSGWRSVLGFPAMSIFSRHFWPHNQLPIHNFRS